MLSEIVDACVNAGLVDGRDRVPDRAASRLNGVVDTALLRENDGGSIRVKGAETRRFLTSPARFDPGERPAGAVRGARGDDVLALIRGVCAWSRVGCDGASLNTGDLIGVLSLLLLRLLGEEKVAGSMFSLSI